MGGEREEGREKVEEGKEGGWRRGGRGRRVERGERKKREGEGKGEKHVTQPQGDKAQTYQ